MTKSLLPLFKITATGNDFLAVDLRTPLAVEIWEREFGATATRAVWVKRWCDRHESLGADGVVFLEADAAHDFGWDFYNSDGGQAEMCGNAARAVSLFVAQKNGKAELKFATRVGLVHARIPNANEIDVELPEVVDSESNLSADGLSGPYQFVRAGVPHAVLNVADIDNESSLRAMALNLKRQPRFTKEGVNVTFVQQLDAHRIKSVTFERGVENFTRACGTGATAAAYTLTRGEDGRKIEVQVPGGTLFVVWKRNRPHLIGPARIVAELHLFREA